MSYDINPVLYRVTVNATGLTGAAPADGFIDNKKIEEYGREGTYPTTLANSRAKARANYRFARLCEELNVNQTVTRLANIVATGANANTAASNFNFTVVYDREEYVIADNELFNVDTHPTSALAILEGADAVKRQVARVFAFNYSINSEFPRNPAPANQGYEWLDEKLDVNTALSGTLEQKLVAAEAQITVSVIANT